MVGEDNENKGYCRAMKNIAADDRPREKALKYGFGALSQAELLAILIGSGTPGESVVELAQRMLQWCDNRLVPLGQKTIGDLKRNFKGIGDAKAITILSAIELAKRYSSEDFVAPQITDSTKAYNLMKFQIGYLPHEEFWVVALNTAKRVRTGWYKFNFGRPENDNEGGCRQSCQFDYCVSQSSLGQSASKPAGRQPHSQTCGGWKTARYPG